VNEPQSGRADPPGLEPPREDDRHGICTARSSNKQTGSDGPTEDDLARCGRYRRALFDYVVEVGRWARRGQAYATLLIIDRYPPFSLQ
jgi:hypothetical protein